MGHPVPQLLDLCLTSSSSPSGSRWPSSGRGREGRASHHSQLGGPISRNRERVERGLYRDGAVYYACATPAGSRTARWKSLGSIGVMEARRLRDEFAAEVRHGRVPAGARERRRASFEAVAHEWLDGSARSSMSASSPRALSTATSLGPAPPPAVLRAIGDRVHRRERPRRLARRPASQRRCSMVDQGPLERPARGARPRRPPRHARRQPSRRADLSEKPKPGASRKRFLTDDEMAVLLGIATGRSHALIALLLFSGLRISEALGLVWSDVDFATGHLRVRYQLSRQGKRVRLKTAGARRDVVVIDSLAGVLDATASPASTADPAIPFSRPPRPDHSAPATPPARSPR